MDPPWNSSCNHGWPCPSQSYNGIKHYKLTNNATVKNWKVFMPPVKTHSTVFNQGQQFVINTHSVSTSPPEHSVLLLSFLSHTHTLLLTVPLLLFPLLGSLLDPLFTLGSVRHHRKGNSCSSSARLPPFGCHSGSYTAPSSLFHLPPLPPLLFSGYICHTNRGHCTNIHCRITALGTVCFPPEAGCFVVPRCVSQWPPTYKDSTKSLGGPWMF